MRHIGGSNRTDLVERARRRSRQESMEDPAKRKLLQKHLAEAGPLLQELVTLGFDIGTLDDLRHQRKSWKSAIPALLRWLPRISDLDVKENIVRCISVPWVGNQATAELIYEFKKYAPIDPQHINEDLRSLSKSADLLSPAWDCPALSTR